MRTAFAHDAVLDLDAGGDLAAPGGAVTRALCGSFDHPPPCPLAPHHTSAVRLGDGVAVRVLFAAPPAAEGAVRSRIDAALAAGFCDGPDGSRTRWTLRTSTPGVIHESDRAHSARLAAN